MSSPSLGRGERQESVIHHMSPLREQRTPLPSVPVYAQPVMSSCNSYKELVINGKAYRVVSKIGSGGSSEVFKVLDENQVTKAIKQVSFALSHLGLRIVAVVGYLFALACPSGGLNSIPFNTFESSQFDLVLTCILLGHSQPSLFIFDTLLILKFN